jgi:hypothetical protein
MIMQERKKVINKLSVEQRKLEHDIFFLLYRVNFLTLCIVLPPEFGNLCRVQINKGRK